MTSPDPRPELIEALWEAQQEFGVTLTVGDQVAIARALAISPKVTPAEVKAAFAQLRLPVPSTSFSKAVAVRVNSLAPPRSLLDVLLDFRQFALRELSHEYGGKTTGHEEQLKNALLGFLPERGYREAHTGRGRMDIRIPPPTDTVIETKVWTGERTYRDGVLELGRYLHTEKPRSAFMVVFGDREPLPSIIDEPGQARAPDEHLNGLTVPVVVVPFEIDAPSKAAANQRRRDRDKRR